MQPTLAALLGVAVILLGAAIIMFAAVTQLQERACPRLKTDSRGQARSYTFAS
ncbi:hypothetical protein [Hydrocarboniphaga sp.]|uniref:hypothetical protein n=1 Tax=Hydrocarboniphaga sp. TaxID=2033016 RepID=UPI003D114B5B